MLGQNSGMENKKDEPEWIRPDLLKERGEIERLIRYFLKEEPSEQSISAVMAILEFAPIIDLSDEEWARLENTDSFNSVRPGRMDDAILLAKNKNLGIAPEDKRNFDMLRMGFRKGNKMEMPAIVKKNGVLHLVSGDTRLTISRAAQIRPKVVIGNLD